MTLASDFRGPRCSKRLEHLLDSHCATHLSCLWSISSSPQLLTLFRSPFRVNSLHASLRKPVDAALSVQLTIIDRILADIIYTQLLLSQPRGALPQHRDIRDAAECRHMRRYDNCITCVCTYGGKL